jgi:non-canonical (house-cleaning) NTP pyrophosphatase
LVTAIHKGREYTSYSSGMKVPKCVSKNLNNDVSNHVEIMTNLRKEYEIRSNIKSGANTWSDYTGGVINREKGLMEAIRNTLIQAFPNDKSFY